MDITQFSNEQIVAGYLILINVVAFIVYGLDKKKAKDKAWRISEATLIGLAVVGGSFGALAGMRIWKHKTRHKKFKYTVPLLFFIHTALLFYFSEHI